MASSAEAYKGFIEFPTDIVQKLNGFALDCGESSIRALQGQV